MKVDYMNGMNKRPGTTFVTKLTRGQRVVGLCGFRGRLYIATGNRVYVLRGSRLKPLRFEA